MKHDWDDGSRFGFVCCRVCCLVKRADGKNRSCKGPSRLRPFEKPIQTRVSETQQNEKEPDTSNPSPQEGA